jgi:hypothetical protein
MLEKIIMKINPDIIFEEEGGEAVLFDAKSLLTAWANETAIVVWKDLSQGLSPEKIESHLQEMYPEVDTVSLREDLHAILKRFEDFGFLEKRSS